jgi:hypothetical protein
MGGNSSVKLNYAREKLFIMKIGIAGPIRLPQNESKKPAEKIIWDEDLKKEVLKLGYPALIRYGYVENYIYNLDKLGA